MFGGPSSSSQQTFLLLPNAAAAAHPNSNVYDPKFHSNHRSSSENDNNSINDHTSFYKREGTFRTDSSPIASLNNKHATKDGKELLRLNSNQQIN